MWEIIVVIIFALLSMSFFNALLNANKTDNNTKKEESE